MDADFTDRVLAIFDAWNRGDFDGWAGLGHPEVEFYPEMPGQLEGRVYRGRDGLRRFWDEWHDVWDPVSVRVDEHEWLGERLLVVGMVDARGRYSGVTVNSPIAWVFDFDGQQIRATRSYLDAAAARDAARRSP
jgi:ketosteroid isomerase-like protein